MSNGKPKAKHINWKDLTPTPRRLQEALDSLDALKTGRLPEITDPLELALEKAVRELKESGG